MTETRAESDGVVEAGGCEVVIGASVAACHSFLVCVWHGSFDKSSSLSKTVCSILATNPPRQDFRVVT